MTNRFTELCIDCADPQRLAEFWCAVLDYKVAEQDDDSVYIEGPESSGPGLRFATVPESKKVKNRLHIDVTPGGDQNAELARLLALGASRVDIGQGDVSWFVLADPEGNEFCLLKGTDPED